MLVREVMTDHPVSVRRGTTLKQALGLMARYGVTSLPLVDGSRRLLGVVSEADLIREAVRSDPRVHLRVDESASVEGPHTVDEVMTPHAVTVHGDTDLADAVELMTTTTVKSLPVVDDHDRVVGMISRSDVVRVLARADEVLAREVDAVLVALGHPDWLVEAHDGVVEVTGPEDEHEQSLASVAARTVPGVIEVRVG